MHLARSLRGAIQHESEAIRVRVSSGLIGVDATVVAIAGVVDVLTAGVAEIAGVGGSIVAEAAAEGRIADITSDMHRRGGHN